jgi:tetratricopeptide (TPR) repeat protein
MIKKTIIPVIIVVIVFCVYCQVLNFDFVSYDDPNYISYSSKKLSLNNITELFVAIDYANWHPLTWLSLMLDHHFYGSYAGGYHLTNLIFHIINTLLLYIVLVMMTGSEYRSAAVAALFALHPLHVESVAWVTERKDVLSTMFWMLTLWAYILYAKKPSIGRYLSVVVFFILGLMSKPMLVTLPFVLLLLDYWPLGRFKAGQNIPECNVHIGSQKASFLLMEKIPLFLITAGSSLLTYIAQNSYKTVATFYNVSLFHRILNAVNSYADYLRKIFWFHNLSPFYLYPKNFEIWQMAGSLLLLVAVTLLTVYLLKKIPYLAVGWFWYLGTLVPVIGLIQVGSQAMADRYTYVPLIGIFIIMAWGIPQALEGLRNGRIIAAAIASAFLIFIVPASYMQAAIWKNDFTLFGHVIKINPRDVRAYQVIGHAMANNGEYDKALYYYSMALKYDPEYYPSYLNAGNVLQEMGKLKEAIDCYQKALTFDEKPAEAHYNLGIIFIETNHSDKAIFHFKQALAITPDDSDTHNNLGVALMKEGNIQEALGHFQDALRLNPQDESAKKNIMFATAALNDAIKKSSK